MRIYRALFAVLVTINVLGWGLPVASVSGAPPAQPGAAVSGQLPPPPGAATIQVTVEGDQLDDPQLPASATSGCSLREALQLLFTNGNRGCGANTPAAPNVIIKMPPGDFVLTIDNELPNISQGQTVYISGPGVVIDGGSQGGRHTGIFHVGNGTLMLNDLKLTHGSRPGGGAILLGIGAVIADKVRFEANDAAVDPALNGTGGAIEDDAGFLTVTNSIFINNLAFDAGGAVNTNFGYFYKDQFLGNKAAAGGAFAVRSYTTYPVFVVESQFKQNLARPQTPAQQPGPGYTTHGDSRGGGAIQNNGNLQLTRVLIQGNSTELEKGGGGLSNESAGTAQLLETVVTQNTASARGSGDSNSFIDYAWGGGIYNAGDLDLVRASVHGNQADMAGAIFNHAPGNLALYNSTVSNNTAKQLYGGLVNENAQFDPAISYGAEIHLYHATIGKNHSSNADPANDVLSAMWPDSVWFGNSILDAGCNVPQYTVGRSIMTGDCITEPDPQITLFPGTDLSNTTQTQLGLQPLAGGNAPVPEFMVQHIDANSIAAGIGRDDNYGCGNAFIMHQDQNRAPRPAHLCDAGAIQAAAVPSHFDSNPAPGLSPEPGIIDFPVVDFTLGQGGSLATLTLFNTGGGALTFQVVDEGGSGAIVNDSGSTGQGTLYKNQQATITFSCHPPAPGYYFRKVSVETDAPNQAQADYLLHCAAVGPNQVADPDSMPGPVNMPNPLPGQAALAGLTLNSPSQTTHSSFTLRNPGHMPLTVSPSLINAGPPWGLTTALASERAPASPAVTLAHGQSLVVDVACTPPGPGVFLNTLVFTTNDPNNPTIKYDLACEAQVVSPPEPLSPALAYNSAAKMEGVAVSPDGAQVVAGQIDTTLQAYDRNAGTGALTPNGSFALLGMSAIQSVKYSHDGQNVYYTSADGNGVVTLNRSGNSLSVGQVITTGTVYICGPSLLCAIGSMHGADGLAVSPDDQFVYVVGYYDNSLTTFQRQANGQLGLFQIITGTIAGPVTNGLRGPVRVTTSPDGQHVYVASYDIDTVAVFQRSGAGVLGFQAAYQNGTGGLTNLHYPADLAVSPDGNFVYVAASGSGAVDVFQRSSADGGLSLSSVITGVTGAWGVALSHDDSGKRLFLAQTSANKVQVFGRDQTTGGLSPVGAANTVTSPLFVAVSPDDLDVYVSLYNGQALQHFQTVRNAPVLTHLSPASAVVGGSGFTLTVSGGRFYPGSQIIWNLFTPTTVFVSEHELQAQIPAGNISALGGVTVTVVTPGPGVGFSNPLPFLITTPAQPPVPSIESLDPPAAAFGGGDLVVLVHGANFAPNAQVYYNHVSVPTLVISGQLLQITLSADILLMPGDGGLEVVNGGGAPALSAPDVPATPASSNSSTVISFKVSPPGVPAVPSLSRLAPASVLSGSAPIWLTLTGYNFSANPKAPSVGRWNGSARPSVVVDAHTLLMNVTKADLAAVKTALVTVLTSGTGASAALSFRVRAANEKPIPVLTGDALKGWTLYVRGSDFVPGAQISLNGVLRATTFINAYELKTTVTAADRGVVIAVSNPAPGGGLSNALVAFLSNMFLPFMRR